VTVLLSSGIQVAGALLFAFVLLHFERRAGRFFLRYWRWSWLAFVVYTAGAVASRLLSASHAPPSPLRIAASVVSLSAGYLQVAWLLAGTYELSRRRVLSTRWIAPSVIGAFLIAATVTLAWINDPTAGDARYWLRVGVRVGLVGLAFGTSAAWLALEARRGSTVGWVLPVALLMYGSSQVLTFYWALPLTGLTAEDDIALRMALGLLDVFLQLLIGLGMVLWLLDREREERKADWQRLAESEERYRTLAENATDAIVTIDLEGRITFANPAAARTFGYRPDELVGQSVAMIVPERDRETHLTSLARYRDTRQRQLSWSALRLVARHKSGRDVPIEVSLSEHAATGVPRITAIVRDLTERQRLEEQVLQAGKMQALDRLAGGIAHDFNNLLLAISVHAEFAAAQMAPDHAARPGLLEIRRAAERAGELTTKLLAFSRKQPIQPRRLDLNVAVSELGAMLARMISEDIAIEIRLTREPAWVDADPGLIDQVLLNLAINARDAMAGGGRLTLATSIVEFDAASAQLHGRARPGPFVCVRVTDTGTGIDPRHLPNIFEPFFTTKEDGKGTGLGLATTYGVARQHDGWIDVESELGIGTSFRVFLPRREAPEASVAVAPVPLLVGGGRETILLVEDEPQVRSVIRRVLASCGYTVLEAPDGPAALALWEVRGHEIDLLISDVVMPRGMTGLDLAASMRRQRPHLRVIFMTGYQAEVNLDRLGPETPLLRKPFSLAELMRTVQDTLAGADALSLEEPRRRRDPGGPPDATRRAPSGATPGLSEFNELSEQGPPAPEAR
jgi:PAS domain S-box-containing protein